MEVVRGEEGAMVEGNGILGIATFEGLVMVQIVFHVSSSYGA